MDLDQEQKVQTDPGARSQICVYDFEVEEDWDKFLLDMDVILVVVDPLPSKLIRHSGRFKQLKQMELAGAKSQMACKSCQRRHQSKASQRLS